MNGPGWRSRVTGALVFVLAVAVVVRVVSGLLDPLLPTLIAFVIIVSLIGLVLRRR